VCSLAVIAFPLSYPISQVIQRTLSFIKPRRHIRIVAIFTLPHPILRAPFPHSKQHLHPDSISNKMPGSPAAPRPVPGGDLERDVPVSQTASVVTPSDPPDWRALHDLSERNPIKAYIIAVNHAKTYQQALKDMERTVAFAKRFQNWLSCTARSLTTRRRRSKSCYTS
jgi:hypothetical protein